MGAMNENDHNTLGRGERVEEGREEKMIKGKQMVREQHREKDLFIYIFIYRERYVDM